MPSTSEVIVAAAGGGKTTRIVERALAAPAERCALVTYTQNNVAEITRRVYRLGGAIPPHVEVWSWYSFLLRELARPYQGAMTERRINGIQWIEGRSDRYARRDEIDRFYFGPDRRIYSDKLSRFICECNAASKGDVIRRLEQRFDRIYIDEVQDIAGHDIDLVELILRSKIKLILVGDHRQSTFRTNNAARHGSFSGPGIIKKFREWEKSKLCCLSYERETHRCHQAIADLADTLFPSEPSTVSLNAATTGHDGVFCIATRDIPAYVETFKPQVLRLTVKTDCNGQPAMNFGESKGMTFDRVLSFPHQLATKWLATGDGKHIAGTASKLYVGITRARHSVAFAFDGDVKLAGVARYECPTL
jgi:DNA helicase II / ATP-dependent DNA helicase PcrA